MPIYTYETIPAKAGGKTRFYEIKQSMTEPALVKHPETGETIRRVVTGGMGVMKKGAVEAPRGGHKCGGPSCC